MHMFVQDDYILSLVSLTGPGVLSHSFHLIILQTTCVYVQSSPLSAD